ncbi:MAG: DNA adenine methylase, partial [Planctomycetaceae bacterium]|nr:DNA adenine methylase [Planctomycetaceae bacterium]
PFAGGAGAALALLQNGAVSRIVLNDLDKRVYAFWRAALNQTNAFIDLIHNIPLTIGEWRRQHKICQSPSRHSQLAVGFATFFMNRCNRSGVISGAGPIGGYHQSGKWRLDARFYRDSLAERVANIGRNRDKISVSNLDAIRFLVEKLPRGGERSKVFAYLDPPYVMKGQRLYLNAFEHDDHSALARYVGAQKQLHWVVSYDSCELIPALYEEHRIANLSLQYTLQQKREAQELFVAPHHVSTPIHCHHDSLTYNAKT